VTAGLPIAWLVARAAGLVAFGLLTLSVWLGLVMSTQLLGPKRQIGAALLDPVLHFGAGAALVPFAAPWKPGAVAAGVVAGWLSPMLAVSFRLRRWIGQKGWRRLHYASFAAFALSLGHALLLGTDLKGLGGPVLTLLAAGPVLWLTFYRLLVPRTAAAPKPAPATA
jgi:hypothetical protein